MRCLRSISVLLLVVACDSGDKTSPPTTSAKTTATAKVEPPPSADDGAPADDGAGTPPADDGGAEAPEGLSGSLTIEGTVVDLATEALRIEASHCTDGDGVEVLVRRGEHGQPLSIRAKVGEVELGKNLTPRTTSTTPAPAPVDVFGFISVEGRGAQATLPESGSVRFDALAAGGPVDVTIDVDFGALGNAKGRIRVPSTQGRVCTHPPPPGPPG